MKSKKIILNSQKNVFLMTYIHQEYTQKWDGVGEWIPPSRPAIILFPGGGYRYCSEREEEPVAFPFLAAGYQVFFLNYRTGTDISASGLLEDAALALWTVRKNAPLWNIDPEKIAVCGFSAGGNLAAMLSTQWYRFNLEDRLSIPINGSKPNATILCYALTEMDTYIKNQPSNKATLNMFPEMNVVNYISEKTPHTFIWTTYKDEKVDIKNSLDYAEKCLEFKVPFELHIFENGQHGLSLNTDLTAYKQKHPINVDQWVPMCINWLNELFKF